MPIFDQFGPGQFGNTMRPMQPQATMPLQTGPLQASPMMPMGSAPVQGSPPPQGSPNFQVGNWGNTPNYANNLQQFMANRGAPPQASGFRQGQPGYQLGASPGAPMAPLGNTAQPSFKLPGS